jgi:hypothetical protein
MAESIKLFLPSGEAKYFCERGWTDVARNSLTGKSGKWRKLAGALLWAVPTPKANLSPCEPEVFFFAANAKAYLIRTVILSETRGGANG